MRPPPLRFCLSFLAVSLAFLGVMLTITLAGPSGGRKKSAVPPVRRQVMKAEAARGPTSANLRVVTLDGPMISGQINFIIRVDLWQGGKIVLAPWETKVWARVDIYEPDDTRCQGDPLLTHYSEPAQMMAGENYREDIPYRTELPASVTPYNVRVRLVNQQPDGTEVTAASQRFHYQVQ